MISWRALLEAAKPLTVGAAGEEFVDRTVPQLGGVKLSGGPGAFRYPKRVADLEAVRAALLSVADDATEAHLLFELLRRPLRVYQLTGAEAAYALVGAWQVDDQIEPRIVALRVVNGTILIDTETYHFGESQDELTGTMEQLYLDMTNDARNRPEPTARHADHVLWLGGSDAETGDPIWKERIEAILSAEGFTTDVRSQPGRDSVAAARAVSEQPFAAVVSWTPRLGSEALATNVLKRSDRRVIQLDEYEFAEALNELRLVLEDEPLAHGEEIDQADPEQPFDAGGPYYFKKIAKRGSGVDMVIHRRDPCSHESWRLASAAPQARAGIELHARRTIRKLEHCNRCDGGGMWRVHFE